MTIKMRILLQGPYGGKLHVTKCLKSIGLRSQKILMESRKVQFHIILEMTRLLLNALKVRLKMVNLDLMNLTLAYIEANPKEWNQETWRCKTGCCFAGTAAMLAGWKWHEKNDLYSPNVIRNGRVLTARRAARRALGVDSEILFYGKNTIEDLRRIVGEYNDEKKL